MRLRYLIRKEQDFKQLLNYIDQVDIFGIDTETNGKWSQFELNLVGISIGFDDFACYIPLTHVTHMNQLDMSYVLDGLRPILESPSSSYVFHNAKFDEKVFKIYGINCQGTGDDTYVLSWLLHEEGSHGLKQLTQKYLGIKMDTYEDVINRGKKRRGIARDYDFANVSLKDALSYAADDAYYTLRLYRIFREGVERENLWQPYINIERPLLRVLRDIELRGILIDREYLDHAAKRYPELMEEIESEVLGDIGEPINIDSGKQLGIALFETLKIGKTPVKTRTGQYKTDKKALEKYAAKYPVVEKILRRKKIKKTYDVFVEGLIPHIQNNRVYANFNSCGTVTGRFSSSKPNMQQIQGDEIEEIRVRDFFQPTPGYVFVVGDFGQIELRVMAHYARDKVAIKAFESGRDFHSETARAMFSLPETAIPTTRQRFYAKALNFGIPYGRGPISVGETLAIKPYCRDHTCGDCAACFIDKWFSGFPSVAPYKDVFLARARQQGYMRTIAGRKRRLPELRAKDYKTRGAAERQAFNTLCQGSSADIIKLGMVKVAPKLKDLGAYILIQVHDELLTEAPIEKAEEVAKVLKETMEAPLDGANPLRLPLNFDPKIVERWSAAK